MSLWPSVNPTMGNATPLLTHLLNISGWFNLQGHSWAEVVAVQPSGVCSAAQLMLLGVKWVLRYQPRAECKDPGCPPCPALPTHN